MITNQAGQVLHDTPNIRLLWRVSKKDGHRWLQSVELNAQGDGTVTDREHGKLNEQVDGKLRLLADRSALNNPGLSDASIGRLGTDHRIIRAPTGLQPTVSRDCYVSNPITMVGLKQDKVVEGKVTEDFEQKGFT